MSQVPAMYSRAVDGSISGVTFYLGANPYQADRSIPTFSDLLAELKKANPSADRLIALTQPAQAIVKAVAAAVNADYLPKGTVSVSTSEVRYNGESVTGVLVDRILSMLAEGFDIMPMVRFLENVYLNPAEFARQELYLWLENNNLPITQDGHFLAYKRVNYNFTSVTGGKVRNNPGLTVSMPRESVDPVRANTCSTGLHFCSKEYLPHFSGPKTILLKINPADVVSIPSDYNNAKGRTWQYTVLEEITYDPQSRKWASVVDPAGKPVAPASIAGPVDPASQPLQFPSDLSKALYAALTEIGVKDGRKRWAGNVLGRTVSTFKELTVGEAGILIEKARAIKADQDANTASKVKATARAAKQVEIDAINGYGIETLRRNASAAGFTAATGRSAYKNSSKAELVLFLISKV